MMFSLLDVDLRWVNWPQPQAELSCRQGGCICGLVLQAQSPAELPPAGAFSRRAIMSPSPSSRATCPRVIFGVIQIKLEQVIKFNIVEPWMKNNEFSKTDRKRRFYWKTRPSRLMLTAHGNERCRLSARQLLLRALPSPASPPPMQRRLLWPPSPTGMPSTTVIQ